MAAGKNKPQPVVRDHFPLFQRGRGIGDFPNYVGMFVKAAKPRVAAHSVDRFEAAGGNQPRHRVGGHAVARPLFGRGDERVMFGFLGAVKATE